MRNVICLSRRSRPWLSETILPNRRHFTTGMGQGWTCFLPASQLPCYQAPFSRLPSCSWSRPGYCPRLAGDQLALGDPRHRCVASAPLAMSPPKACSPGTDLFFPKAVRIKESPEREKFILDRGRGISSLEQAF